MAGERCFLGIPDFEAAAHPERNCSPAGEFLACIATSETVDRTNGAAPGTDDHTIVLVTLPGDPQKHVLVHIGESHLMTDELKPGHYLHALAFTIHSRRLEGLPGFNNNVCGQVIRDEVVVVSCATQVPRVLDLAAANDLHPASMARRHHH